MKKGNCVLATAILTLSLAACADSSKEQNVADLTRMCNESTNMGQEICDCVANKATTELSSQGFDFVLANMKKEESKAKEIAKTLEVSEAAAAGMFMFKAPGQCAKELSKKK
ncbi:MAG: hypothetical protein HOC23_23475 [Halieaceae bacterium]|jgi:hypothetical protein|nr:hypothetical protein [Halieaceae bacterium]